MRVFVSVLAGGLIVGAGALALAQESGVTVTDDIGAVISLSPGQVYRALGDRLVSGNDVIGNNTGSWSQIDPMLSSSPIRVTLPYGIDEETLLDMIRFGCREYSGSFGACSKVGLRRDILSGDGPRVARIDPERLQRALPAEQPAMSVEPAPPPPPPPPPDPVVVIPSIRIPVEAVQIESIAGGASAPLVAPIPRPAPATPAPAIPAVAIAPQPVRQERIYASRLFLGRDSFPPEAFAAYGILAFQTLSTSEDRQAYMAICEAFFGALLNSDDVAADISRQMVTVWPIDDRKRPDLIDDLNTTRAQEGSCEDAVEFYDIQIARGAIGDARQAGVDLTGRGPFLLAWAPAAMKGHPDAVVLAADLSNVKTVADAKDVLRIWREDIEQDPELWEDGFSLEKMRVKLRQVVNRYGDGLLRFFGG